MYMPTCQLYPLLSTISWQTTNPIILPKLGQVAQKPSSVVSLSGEHTLWTSGSKLGQVKDCKNPLNPISMTRTANALSPVIIDIEIGTKQYYSEQSSRATQIAWIGFESGRTAIRKLPSPINNSITESTMPINYYDTLICYGRNDLLNEYVVLRACTLV